MAIVTWRKASKEYPPLRLTVEVVEGAVPKYWWSIGVGRLFDSARKKSLAKDEKDVKLPQKPVASPMYSGIAFFRFVASALRMCSKSLPSDLSFHLLREGSDPSLNIAWSSVRNP